MVTARDSKENTPMLYTRAVNDDPYTHHASGRDNKVETL